MIASKATYNIITGGSPGGDDGDGGVLRRTPGIEGTDLFGIILKKSKTKNIAAILRLTHNLSRLEKLNFAALCLEIRDLPTIRLSFC